jgi:hypothetical protein
MLSKMKNRGAIHVKMTAAVPYPRGLAHPFAAPKLMRIAAGLHHPGRSSIEGVRPPSPEQR